MKSFLELFKSNASESDQDKKAQEPKFYQITGKATFKVEVQVSGKTPYSSCVLSVNIFTNSNERVAIASRCEWFRTYYNQNFHLKGSGNTYRVSALDIGAKIRVKVIPTEPDEIGEAVVTFGPILMDPSQKASLKNVIKSGGAKFDFESISPYHIDEGTHAGSLVVFQTNIKINMLNAQKKDLRIFFGEPFELQQGNDDRTIFIKINDGTKQQEIAEYFGLKKDRHPERLQVRLISQASRDNFIITVRSFCAMIDLKDKILLDKTLEYLPSEFGDNKRPSLSLDDISTRLDDTSLQRELYLLNKQHEQVSIETEKLSQQVNLLDGEIYKSNQGRQRVT
jgi:hypothetical protein